MSPEASNAKAIESMAERSKRTQTSNELRANYKNARHVTGLIGRRTTLSMHTASHNHWRIKGALYYAPVKKSVPNNFACPGHGKKLENMG